MTAAVVKLPTAAPRQVKQRWNRQTRALREQLPQFPKDRARFAFRPEMHRAMKEARLILECEPSPAMRLATALLLSADEAAQRKAEIFLALQANSEAARQALALIRYETGSTSHKLDVSRAFELILNGEAE